MDKAQALHYVLTIIFAIFFSGLRTLADNRDKGIKGTAFARLLIGNGILGLGSGLLAVPLSMVLGMNVPSVHFLISAFAGWTGIEKTMHLVEEYLPLKGKPSHADSQSPGPHLLGNCDSHRPSVLSEESEPNP